MDKADHGRTHDDAAAQLVDAQSQSLGSLKPKGAFKRSASPKIK
jgi:hypothetical protein